MKGPLLLEDPVGEGAGVGAGSAVTGSEVVKTGDPVEVLR